MVIIIQVICSIVASHRLITIVIWVRYIYVILTTSWWWRRSDGNVVQVHQVSTTFIFYRPTNETHGFSRCRMSMGAPSSIIVTSSTEFQRFCCTSLAQFLMSSSSCLSNMRLWNTSQHKRNLALKQWPLQSSFAIDDKTETFTELTVATRQSINQ